MTSSHYFALKNAKRSNSTAITLKSLILAFERYHLSSIWSKRKHRRVTVFVTKCVKWVSEDPLRPHLSFLPKSWPQMRISPRFFARKYKTCSHIDSRFYISSHFSTFIFPTLARCSGVYSTLPKNAS